MYDDILEYGLELKQRTTVTPVSIIVGFMSPKEILQLKKDLNKHKVICKKYVEGIDDCFERLRQSTDEQDVVYYTLNYINFRNPMVSDVITEILGGMF